MKVAEFSRALEDSLTESFGSEVTSKTQFSGGVFCVTGFLVANWKVDHKIPLYDIRIQVINNDLKITYIDISFTGEDSDEEMTLENGLVYIKENLTTTKSKIIYENL